VTVAILDHLWQSTLVAFVLGTLTFLFRNNSASVRHGLWFAASVKFLFPFSLLALLGRVLLPHPVPDTSIQMLAKVETVTVPFASGVPALATPQPDQMPWTLVALAVWALGFITLAVFWLVQWSRLTAVARSANASTLHAPVPIRITPDLLEPGLVGILSPIILLPDAVVRQLSNREIDAILAHELCHWRRKDNLLTLVHMLVEAVFWFHPLVWFIGHHLVEESERACDDSVLDSGKKPIEYAETILRVCRLTCRSGLPCASGISGSDLDRRITAIMVGREVDDIDPNKILLLTALSLFAVVTPFVAGGSIPAPKAHSLQRLIQPFAAQGQSRQPVVEVPARTRPMRHHFVRASGAGALPPASLVAAPAIQVDSPMIILPEPRIEADTPTSSTDATEALVCRRAQQLPDSQLMGPRVCLSKKTWDLYEAKGLVLMPDGETLVARYNQTRRPILCLSMVSTASNAMAALPSCRL
jgi:beta-lactamase regulating signal transducer with metallopeptidase domain